MRILALAIGLTLLSGCYAADFREYPARTPLSAADAARQQSSVGAMLVLSPMFRGGRLGGPFP